MSFRRKKEGSLLSVHLHHSGYYFVHLWVNNEHKNYILHRLIAEAFIPNPNNYPLINHINGIKTDNRIENLEWCTHSHNMKHSYKMHPDISKGERNSCSKLKEWQVLEIYEKAWKSNLNGVKIGALYGISWKHVNDIKHGRSWSYLTHHFDVINKNRYFQTELVEFSA
jgi:hypothetical protein